WADADFAVRPAPREYFQHVADGGPGRTGHQSDALRKGRQRLLAARIEVSELRKLFLELPQRQFSSAQSLGLQLLDQQLILAARRIDAEPATDDDFEAVVRLEANTLGRAPIDDGTKLGFRVLQREINVP